MSREKIHTVFLFAVACAAACLIVSAFTPFYSDSDSSCYSYLSQKLAEQPPARWCAPQWEGHGGNQGLFRDHPPGILWLPAVMIRLGVKKSAAALWANFLYILFGLYFIFRLASLWGGRAFGWGAVWAYALTPIFVQYLIRANQEPPLNLAVAAGIYGLARSREARRYGILFVAALLFAVAIKGMSAVILSLLAVLYWLVVSRNRRTFVFILAGHLAAAAAVVAFELWYRGVAQTSFLSGYLSFQGGRSFGPIFHPLRRLYGLAWYGGRALWFAAPWVYFLLYGFLRSKKSARVLWDDLFLRFLAIGSLAVIVLFAMSDRKADRYIFPAYTLLAIAGSRVWLTLKPKAADFLARHERQFPLWLAGGLVAAVFVGSVFHPLLNHFHRFWPQ